MNWVYDQLCGTFVEVCRMAWNNCIWEPVVKGSSSQQAKVGLIADFATRGVWGNKVCVWERSRDGLFDTRSVQAGGR